MALHLYGFWRSLATYRVRISLNLKGIEYRETPIDLDTGEQDGAEFRRLNPMGAVPALVEGDRPPLTQSLAILEYLEDVHPSPALLPGDARGKARVRSLCLATAADTHPLVVPRVQRYLSEEWSLDEPKRLAWNAHWFRRGLEAYEAALSGPETGRYCHGDAVTLADLCLASHVAGAQRFKVDLAPYSTVGRIHATCQALDAFARAHPLRQPGAPEG